MFLQSKSISFSDQGHKIQLLIGSHFNLGTFCSLPFHPKTHGKNQLGQSQPAQSPTYLSGHQAATEGWSQLFTADNNKVCKYMPR